jgi:hypothetical protein
MDATRSRSTAEYSSIQSMSATSQQAAEIENSLRCIRLGFQTSQSALECQNDSYDNEVDEGLMNSRTGQCLLDSS